MTDKHMDGNNAEREVGARTLVSVRAKPVVLPETLAGRHRGARPGPVLRPFPRDAGRLAGRAGGRECRLRRRGEAVLGDWLAAGVAGDAEAGAGLVAADATWIGLVVASLHVFVEGAAPRRSPNWMWDGCRSVPGSRTAGSWASRSGFTTRIQLRPSKATSRGSKTNIRGVSLRRATDSGSNPCSELLTDTVEEWATAIR